MMAKELRLKSACRFDEDNVLVAVRLQASRLCGVLLLSTLLPLLNTQFDSRNKNPTYSPSTLNILRFRGSSLAYPIFASAASALPSLPAPLATDAFLPAPVCVMLMLLLPVSISFRLNNETQNKKNNIQRLRLCCLATRKYGRSSGSATGTLVKCEYV